MPNASTAVDRRRLLTGRFTSAAAGKPFIAPPTQHVAGDTQSIGAEQSTFSVTTVPSIRVLALNRMGFGPRPGDRDKFDALGFTDDMRLQAYIEQQLYPELIDDSDLDQRISQQNFQTIEKSLAELWIGYLRTPDLTWHEIVLPWKETVMLKYLRAIYSKRQLLERIVEFWHDHFNVYANEFPMIATLLHYDRDVIRPYAFSNFRLLLGAVAQSTSMQFFIDNVNNSADGPNENYARELLELHTLGAEHYYEATAPEDVPGYPLPDGFVEEDVFAVARALTGWTVRQRTGDPVVGDTGEFFFDDTMHDTAAKVVVGHALPAGQSAEQDGNMVLDILAAHPSTAKFICQKLVCRLVNDSPPETLVDSAAAIFLENSHEADQLRRVLRHILNSAEFKASWHSKAKRPFDALVSALRAADCDYSFQTYDDPITQWVEWLYGSTGHVPFECQSVKGYSDRSLDWMGSGTFVARWRLYAGLTEINAGDGTRLLNIASQRPAELLSANQIADFWIDRVFGYELASAERMQFVEFMAQGRNPDYELDLDDALVIERMRALVSLMFMSPDFQWR